MKPNLRSVQAAPLLDGDGRIAARAAIRGRRIGIALGLVGTVLFSLKAVFVKLAYAPGAGLAENALDPISLMGLRMGFAAPVYAAILIWAWRRAPVKPGRADVWRAGLLGMLGYYVCAWLDFSGLQYITAQLERLILFTYPAFVIGLGAAFFGAKLTGRAVLSVAIAYSGLAVVFVGGAIAVGSNVPLGSAMILGAAILFALFQLLAKPQIDRIGGVVFTCLAMIGTALGVYAHIGVAHLAGSGQSLLGLPPRLYLLGALIAFASTLLPSFCVNLAIGRIGPQAVAALGMFSPVATIVMAIWLLGEPFSWVDGLGTLITIGGISLYILGERQMETARQT